MNNSIAFETLFHKFENLPDNAKKEVYDFIEFMTEKTKRKKKKPDKKKIDRKKILLGMSYWDDEDIKNLQEARRHMNQWQPRTF